MQAPDLPAALLVEIQGYVLDNEVHAEITRNTTRNEAIRSTTIFVNTRLRQYIWDLTQDDVKRLELLECISTIGIYERFVCCRGPACTGPPGVITCVHRTTIEAQREAQIDWFMRILLGRSTEIIDIMPAEVPIVVIPAEVVDVNVPAEVVDV